LSTDEKSAPATARERPDRSSGGQALSFLKELLIVVVGAVIVSSLLRAFVGQMFIIPSESMESTLLRGDRVVVQKITGFERGDVVVFRDPGGWLSEPVEEPGPFDRVLEFVGLPTKSTPGHLIKRVIGLPGDTIKMRKGVVRINGVPLREPYLNPLRDLRDFGPQKVPPDTLFVMGDNRANSNDSRFLLGPIPMDRVVGKAFVVIWPPSRVGWLHGL
jgi:signal peptidase I